MLGEDFCFEELHAKLINVTGVGARDVSCSMKAPNTIGTVTGNAPCHARGNSCPSAGAAMHSTSTKQDIVVSDRNIRHVFERTRFTL